MNERNKTLFAANVLGTIIFSAFAFAVSVALVIVPWGIWWETWGYPAKGPVFAGFIVEAAVFIYMGIMLLGMIFGWMGYKMKNTRIIFTSVVLYTVCTLILCFIFVGVFMLPIPILGFIGYRKQKKLNAGSNVIYRI